LAFTSLCLLGLCGLLTVSALYPVLHGRYLYDSPLESQLTQVSMVVRV